MNIDEDTIKNLLHYGTEHEKRLRVLELIAQETTKARLDELYEAIDVPIANLPSYLADRIAQLRSTPND